MAIYHWNSTLYSLPLEYISFELFNSLNQLINFLILLLFWNFLCLKNFGESFSRINSAIVQPIMDSLPKDSGEFHGPKLRSFFFGSGMFIICLFVYSNIFNIKLFQLYSPWLIVENRPEQH